MVSRNQWKQELKAKENAPPPKTTEMTAEQLKSYLVDRMETLGPQYIARFAREILPLTEGPEVTIEDIQRRGKGIELHYRVTEHYA